MTLDETTRFKTDAELLRTLMGYGFVSAHDVVAWADRQIEAVARPDDTLVEIAMSALGSQDLNGLLHAVPGTVDRDLYLTGLFSRLAERLEMDTSQVQPIVSMLYEMSLDARFDGLAAADYLGSLNEGELGGIDDADIAPRVKRALQDLASDPHAQPTREWLMPEPFDAVSARDDGARRVLAFLTVVGLVTLLGFIRDCSRGELDRRNVAGAALESLLRGCF